MDDLVEFLVGRLANATAVARAAGGRAEQVWVADLSGKDPLGQVSWPAVVRYTTDGRLRGAVAHMPVMAERSEDRMQHIALHDPASALRRIAADRALLRLHGDAHECATYDRGEINGFAYVASDEHCSTVLILAEQYGWTDLPTCGATTVFWPDDEACDAECMLRPWHEGKHKDATLGEWPED